MAKLVIAEDAPHMLRLLEMTLRKAGHTWTSCTDGAAAVAATGTHLPDAVILDIIMPVMDGKEVCRILRSTPELAGLFVIAYTAHAMESERQSIMAAGFDDLLVKPISGQDLLRVLPD